MCQPLPAVEADLNREGEPGLNAGVQETEDGMNGGVIQEQALAHTRLELQMLGGPVAVDLEAAAWLDAGQHAHRPLSDPVFGSNAASDILLVDFGRGQVTHRSTQRVC